MFARNGRWSFWEKMILSIWSSQLKPQMRKGDPQWTGAKSWDQPWERHAAFNCRTRKEKKGSRLSKLSVTPKHTVKTVHKVAKAEQGTPIIPAIYIRKRRQSRFLIKKSLAVASIHEIVELIFQPHLDISHKAESQISDNYLPRRQEAMVFPWKMGQGQPSCASYGPPPALRRTGGRKLFQYVSSSVSNFDPSLRDRDIPFKSCIQSREKLWCLSYNLILPVSAESPAYSLQLLKFQRVTNEKNIFYVPIANECKNHSFQSRPYPERGQ